MKKFFHHFDWIQLFLTLLLCAIGATLIFSATYTQDQPFSFYFKKQLVGLISGIIIYFAFAWFDYRSLLAWGYFGFWLVIALLVFTLIKGSIGMGAQRWINLIFFKLQPSELVKLLLPPFAMYSLHSTCTTAHYSFKHFVPILITLGVIFVLVVKQPDLGTGILVALTGVIMLWFAGLPRSFFIYTGLVLLLCTPICWRFLKPYQKNRIAVFLGYGQNDKERYQTEQASIAIGSGGLFGKGFLQGTQNKFRFLPESRTDFIFAVLCEETGFIGGLLVLIIFLFLFIRIILDIQTIMEHHIQILAMGLLLHIILSLLINIGMVTSLLPIVGIPLPLMSYGLCNLWVCMASLGWIHGIIIQRKIMGEFSPFKKI